MIKLRKYLKPFLVHILIVFCILGSQAFLDLSLPNLTGRIVDVGIGRNGIENSVPEIISDEQFKILKSLLSEEKVWILNNSYTFYEKNYKYVDPNSAVNKKFSDATDYDFYHLNNLSAEETSALNDILQEPVAIMYYANKNSGLDKMLTEENFYDFYDNTKIFTDEEMQEFKSQSFLYIRTEYLKMGADMQKIQTDYILDLGKQMLAISLLSFALVVISSLIVSRMATGVAKSIRYDLFEKVISFSSTEFDKFSTSSLITRSTNDIQQVQTLIVMVRFLFFAPIMAIGGAYMILQTNREMANIVFIAVFVIMGIIAILFKFTMPKFLNMQKLNDKLNLVLRERLTGTMVVRAFNTEKYEDEKFDGVNKNLSENFLFIVRVMLSMQPLMMFIMNMAGVAILWYGGVNVAGGTLSTGDIMKYIQYATQIMFSFLIVSMLSIMIPRANISAKRLVEVLETENSIIEPKNPKKINESETGLVGTLEFKNVSFTYSEADEKVLDNISFKVSKGETVAFIGSTGSGKSTLINLIPRFYDVTEGEIFVNGENVKDVETKELRRNIGFVPQKAFLFSGDIESNIKYGDKEVSEDEMIKAAKISQAYDFITEKDKKFEETISQGGSNVSGGQRQRLAIARAIAKNPDIFIFDDSFSALDYATDKKLRQELNKELSDKTKLIVAQRISTVRDAQQIIVLDEGKIVGMGTHKDLLDNCSVYKQIALSQLSEEELA